MSHPADTQSYDASQRPVDLGRPKGPRQFADNLVKVLVWLAALLAIIPLLWILLTVAVKGAAPLFTSEPNYTKICAVGAKAPTDSGLMDFKRAPASDCDHGTGDAKWTWLAGGHYPAVGSFVEYNPVTPTTVDPNAPKQAIRIKGQNTNVTQAKAVVGIPGSDASGTIRQFSLQWWTQGQFGIDQNLGQGGGALHAIIGTLLIGLLTSVIAVPIAVLGAIYLIEYGRPRWLARAVSFMVDILTGVPSIVAALFVYALMFTVLGFDRSTLAASLALVLLMLPTVLRSTEEMLKLVPHSLREASYALGVPKWKTIVSVVIPTSYRGIATGVMLGIARVMGETAPLLILINYGVSVSGDVLSNNMGSLPMMIKKATDVAPTYPGAQRGWAAALTLILIVMGLNLIAKSIGRPKKSKR